MSKKMNYSRIKDGETVWHSDGSWSERSGDTIWHSDGSWSTQIGDTTWHDDGSWSSSGGGCYLTTACIMARNLPDDCEELTVLRNFRDNYLKKSKNGAEDIKHYYDIAPRIVEKINQSEHAKEMFNELYRDLVLPCVRYIKAGQYESAYSLYKATALRLEAEMEEG